jgi:hypothetical protein
MRRRKGRARSRFIVSSGVKACLAEEAFELGAADRILVGAGIEHDDDVMARNEPILAEAPAFPNEPPGPVAGNRIRIGADGYENGPVDREGVRQDVQPHALAREPGPRSEDLLDLGAFSDPLVLGIAVPGDLETSSPEGRLSTASSRRRR